MNHNAAHLDSASHKTGPHTPGNKVPALWFAKVGADTSRVLDVEFFLEPALAAGWGIPSASPSPEDPKLTVYLSCLSTEILHIQYESLAPKTVESIAEAVASLHTEWPTDGTLFVHINGVEQVAPSTRLDVTRYISPGANVVRFTQLASMVKYTFILHVSRCEPLQDASRGVLSRFPVLHETHAHRRGIVPAVENKTSLRSPQTWNYHPPSRPVDSCADAADAWLFHLPSRAAHQAAPRQIQQPYQPISPPPGQRTSSFLAAGPQIGPPPQIWRFNLHNERALPQLSAAIVPPLSVAYEPLIVQVLTDHLSDGRTVSQALNRLDGLDGYPVNNWKDYYLDHRERLDSAVALPALPASAVPRHSVTQSCPIPATVHQTTPKTRGGLWIRARPII
ncbi:hypothetical protein C8R46DRAFT_1219298 [Mycena filopes]|nr:hypothetical protein C8R46DRAFT_1219298 [Mycena filopes]